MIDTAAKLSRFNQAIEMLRYLRAILLAMLLLPTIGGAMDFSMVSRNPVDGNVDKYPSLLMKGEIVPGDYGRFMHYVIDNRIDLLRTQIILSSPGGDVTEALHLGRLIKALFINVVVGPIYGSCASACFILYASSVDRISDPPGLIGIHRPYVSSEQMRTLSVADAELFETRALTEAEKYLHELRVPNALIDAMFENASTEIHWLDGNELEVQLGRRQPWFEELLISRCGLNKQEELAYLHDPMSNPHFLANNPVFSCQKKLILTEQEKALDKALAPFGYGYSFREGGMYILGNHDPDPELAAVDREGWRKWCTANPVECEFERTEARMHRSL